MPAITSRTSNSAVVNDSIPLPKTFPGLPEPVKKRFPEMADWEESTRRWWSSAFTAITEFNREGVTIINQNYAEAKNLRVSVNGLTAEIIEINEVIISGDTATARRLISVSAMAGVSGSITVAAVAPGAPVLDDYWIDTSNPAIPITYRWDGGAWVEVTTPISSAGVANEVTARIAAVTAEQTARITEDGILASSISTVAANLSTETTNRIAAVTAEETARITADGVLASDITTVSAAISTETSDRIAAVSAEATARATADGNLEGKYTLTVAAGDVVTGMNITSASGPGTNISDVTFVAQNFKIYNSVSGVEMFSVSGTAVKLGATLTVDTANSKVYIGTGTFNNTNTAFYVDSTGQFSLKDQLSWNGTALSIAGSILSGGLNVGTAGNVRGGQTAYATGTGFWIGYDSGSATHRFSVGDATNYIRFDGTSISASFIGVVDQMSVTTGGKVITFVSNASPPGIAINNAGTNESTWTSVGLSFQTIQVVTQQQAAVADATGAGDVVAQLNALLARLRTHGLIAT